jgi:hypothetical protein
MRIRAHIPPWGYSSLSLSHCSQWSQFEYSALSSTTLPLIIETLAPRTNRIEVVLQAIDLKEPAIYDRCFRARLHVAAAPLVDCNAARICTNMTTFTHGREGIHTWDKERHSYKR